jgi:hypothetical protein
MATMLTLDDELVVRLQRQAQARQTPWQQWARMILTQASDRSGDPPSWKQLNRRRLDLIQRKYHGGLEEAEARELTALQALADQQLQALDRPRLEWLAPYEELAATIAPPSPE